MDSHFLNYRQVGRRLMLTGALELTSPCHIGGATADATSDQPLLRDGEGQPYLPGTTLTGLLRSFLERTDSTAARLLFGTTWDDPTGKQARLLLSDARIDTAGSVATELRDGVAIDPCRGVAAKNKKYDMELLPVGTHFHLRAQLELYGDSGRDRPLLEGLLTLLHALETRQIALGARSRRGFGATGLVADEQGCYWRVEDYAVATVPDLYAWLGRELSGLPADWPSVKSMAYQDAAALAEQWQLSAPSPVSLDGFIVTVKLAVSASLLIGSEGHDPQQPDRSQLQRWRLQDGKLLPESVLPATSLAGVLRHRCLRIARTLAEESQQEKAERLIGEMFGPAQIRKQQRAWASRVIIREAPIRDGQFLRHTRVRIDPWTGGAVESLLFTEDALYGGQVEVEICLHDHGVDWAAPARALLLLALRDLANGELNVGAEGGVGRGQLRPLPEQSFVTVTKPAARLYLQADGTVRCDPPDAFATEFEALQGYFGEGGDS